MSIKNLIEMIKHNGLLASMAQLEKLYQAAIENEQKLAELEARCAALAAENAGLNNFIKDDCWVWDDKAEEYIDAVDCMPEIPATDAFLAEVRAQGVEMFAQKCDLKAAQSLASDVSDNWKLLGLHASYFAAQLRKGVQS
ncbi:TPA: hypothetical protein ACNH9M_002506 [Enterobacter hormaechei]